MYGIQYRHSHHQTPLSNRHDSRHCIQSLVTTSPRTVHSKPHIHSWKFPDVADHGLLCPTFSFLTWDWTEAQNLTPPVAAFLLVFSFFFLSFLATLSCCFPFCLPLQLSSLLSLFFFFLSLPVLAFSLS